MCFPLLFAITMWTRIFKCKVEAVEGKKTLTGDDYFKLTARAYIPVTDGNKEVIASIDSGIRKEVSVGCAVEESICSVCGKAYGSSGCNHQKGKTYGDTLCYAELISPYDAYEWSFVAVPAQREAGVTKSFKNPEGRNEMNMDGIMKSLEKRAEVAFTKAECSKLFDYIRELEKNAVAGKEYRKSLESEFTRLMALLEPEISETAVKASMTGLDTENLKEFIKAMNKKAEGVFSFKPQLATNRKARSKASQNNEFTI